jgi:tRNA pseudouridine55 synthase
VDAILNTLKPSGMTSHDVVAFARKKLPGVKIGHTGTLDPHAAGVLPLCLGSATRLSEYLLEGTKGYRGEVLLGIETDTLDAGGKEISRESVGDLSLNSIKEVFLKNTGESEQVPPSFSAVHYKGKKAYKWAHQGEMVDLPSRKIMIYRLDFIDIIHDGAFPRIIFDVECSHGTYIRVLARKIGRDLGYAAHLSFLLRTFVGPFTIDTAETLENIEARVADNTLNLALMPMDYIVRHLSRVTVTDEALLFLSRGNYLYPGQIIADRAPDCAENKKELIRIYDSESKFWGLGRWQLTANGPMFKPEKIFRNRKEDDH